MRLITRPVSLRLRLISGILILATACFAMVIATGHLHRNLAYQNQRNAITELIGLKITNILEELSKTSKNLGLELQSSPELRDAIKNSDLDTITSILDVQFNRYYVTSGMLKLVDIYVFDEDFNFMISSSKTQNTESAQQLLYCSNMTAIAKKRVGSERLKPMSQVCTKDHESLFGVMVPVGTLKPFAYMLIISNPAYNVIQLEKSLGDPIKIDRYNGDNIYQSPVWPNEDQINDYLIATHVLRDPNGTTILKTYAARDIEPYRQQLVQHAIILILVSTIIFALVIGAVVYTLKVSLKPLDELQAAANNLSKGEHVKVTRTSIPEIDVVIQSYNHMSENIVQLISKLQNEILDHKKTEENLKKHQHDLKLARDQAFAASRAKSVFLANMSHELRTPLNAIIGYSDIMHDDAKAANDAQQLDDLTNIKIAGQHLLSIIDNILDLSKIEAGKIELSLNDFQILDLVKLVASTIQPIADNRSNKLSVNCNDSIGRIYADYTKLQQILLNVLENACKFTEQGDITLSVDGYRHNDQDWIRFTISDTGIGISEEHARTLFSEFTQVDSSTTKRYQGAGLGLALSQRFCELMGGYISFESEFGKGSVFTISIPRKVVTNTPPGYEFLRDIHNSNIRSA